VIVFCFVSSHFLAVSSVTLGPTLYNLPPSNPVVTPLSLWLIMFVRIVYAYGVSTPKNRLSEYSLISGFYKT